MDNFGFALLLGSLTFWCAVLFVLDGILFNFSFLNIIGLMVSLVAAILAWRLAYRLSK